MGQPARLAIGFLLAPVLLSAVLTTFARAEADLSACQHAATADARAPRLQCELPYVFDDHDRRQVSRDTLGMIQDMRCLATIDLEKIEIAAMLKRSLWQIPEQPVTCQIDTSSHPVDARFTLSPEVRFDETGRATEARLNLSDLEGMPALIARALTSYVNNSTHLERSLVRTINAHIEREFLG